VRASAGQAPPALEEFRATFVPGDRLHPVPDDVLVTEVTAGGVPAHWLAAPGTDADRVLLFLHGGGFEVGSVRSDGELAARLGRASGMRVLFPDSGASMTERAEQDPISTPAMLRQFAADYLAGADPETPLASPLFATLAGLPPLLIQVSTADLLLSDSERLAAAAAEAAGRRHPSDRPGPAPRLPAPARHPRGGRGHRADRKVPAGPGAPARRRVGSAKITASRSRPGMTAR
jgi:acetyl esterase/lipase